MNKPSNIEQVWILDHKYIPETNIHEFEYIFRPFHTIVNIYISSKKGINSLISNSEIVLSDTVGALTQYNEKTQTIKLYFQAPVQYLFLLHETIHAYIAMISFTGLPNKLNFETHELHAYSLSRFQTTMLKKLNELNLLEPITEEEYG